LSGEALLEARPRSNNLQARIRITVRSDAAGLATFQVTKARPPLVVEAFCLVEVISLGTSSRRSNPLFRPVSPKELLVSPSLATSRRRRSTPRATRLQARHGQAPQSRKARLFTRAAHAAEMPGSRTTYQARRDSIPPSRRAHQKFEGHRKL